VGGLVCGVSGRRVDPTGRQHQTGDVEVRRGESELAAEHVAPDDPAGDGVGAPQHLAGDVKISLDDAFAKARAADGFSIQRDGRHAVDGKTQFRAEFLEEGDVAAAAMAKHEISPNANALDGAKLIRQDPDECFAGLSAEVLVEVNQQERLRAEAANRPDFLWQRIDERGHASWSHNGIGMLVKGDDHGGGVMLASIGNGLANDLLVAEVDAIKEPEGKAHSPAGFELSW